MEVILILIFIAWICLTDLFAEMVFGLAVLIWYAIRFAFICLWEAMKYAVLGVAWLAPHILSGLRWIGLRVWRGAAVAFRFSVLIVQELRADASPEAQTEHENPAAAPPDPYELAIRLLGLAPGFTQASLRQAYKRAIRTAHPDSGGSSQAAQAVNGAYALILRAHGWTR